MKNWHILAALAVATGLALAWQLIDRPLATAPASAPNSTDRPTHPLPHAGPVPPPARTDATPDEGLQDEPASQAPTPQAPNPESAPQPRPVDADYLSLSTSLLDEASFIAAMTDGSHQTRESSPVALSPQHALEIYQALTHVIAGQFRSFDAARLSATPELERQLIVGIRRTQMLQSLLPDLPSLIRSGKVRLESSVTRTGQTQPPAGHIKGDGFFTYLHPPGSELRVTMTRGSWRMNMTISRDAVASSIWDDMVAKYVDSLSQEMRAKWVQASGR